MNLLAVFLTSFLACCCAIVFVPLAGLYGLAYRAERCVMKNLPAASERERLTAQIAVVGAGTLCEEVRQSRAYRSFFQAVTLLRCDNERWYAVSTASGADTSTVDEVTRVDWLQHSVLGGAEGDCF
jgi:hypothetical protein